MIMFSRVRTIVASALERLVRGMRWARLHWARDGFGEEKHSAASGAGGRNKK